MKLSEVDPSRVVKLLLYGDSGAGMNKELYRGDMGPEGSFVVKLEGEMLKFEMNHDSKGAMVSSSAAIRMDYFLDKLAEAIPGAIDDVVIDIIKEALK